MDQQFIDIMGSPYLLAHGLGVPIKNAKTQLNFPTKGQYFLWVRTKDWCLIERLKFSVGGLTVAI